jgi:FixJ family two-component response regulator
MTGADLSREVLKVRPDIPIILCTGFSEIITEEKAKELGIREFLMKPITMKHLAEVIRRVLDRKASC